MPWIFRMRYKIISVFIGIGYVIVFTGIRYVVYYFCNICFFNETKEQIIKELFTAYTISWEVRASLVFSLYAFFTRFTLDWFQNQKQKADLINQNQASELALLRSQINPHFLFNTLNNIYSLVYKKSNEAPEAVMKLSSIMRYTLYDSNTDKVLLEKEVEYLKSFIELQQLRLKKENFVDFRINGNINNYTITPMLFIPFVENAFKHGNKNTPSPGIVITLIVEGEKIIFEVMNYLRTGRAVNKDTVGGIGLQNIKRRLDLLYKDKHKLDINTRDERFIVKLEISSK